MAFTRHHLPPEKHFPISHDRGIGCIHNVSQLWGFVARKRKRTLITTTAVGKGFLTKPHTERELGLGETVKNVCLL